MQIVGGGVTRVFPKNMKLVLCILVSADSPSITPKGFSYYSI